MQELHFRRLPIVIAITGHRNLRSEDTAALSGAIESVFAELEQRYPSTPLLLLTPLAEGADQLAAEIARRRSIPYRVPIPMPLQQYRADFADPERRAEFEALLSAADGPPYEIPFFESNDAQNIDDERRRSHQYALLAAHLGRAAHILIALWDGLPSQSTGGTAQTVRFRVLGVPRRYHRKSLIDAPETGPVYHVYARRAGGAEPSRPVGTRTLRVRRVADDGAPSVPHSLTELFAQIDERPAEAPDPFATLYARIEAFNADCARVERGDAGAHESVVRALMRSSERVATYYQRKFVRALQTIFFATGLGVLTFLLYADVWQHVHPLVTVYLLAFAVAVWTFLSARHGRWQDRAQDYRALEIGLHVQQAWDAAGLRESVADFYIRRQRSELDWIRDAIRTARTVDGHRPFDAAHAVAAAREFVLHQYAYFAGTGADRRLAEHFGGARRTGGAARERRKARRYKRLNRIALRVSFAFSAFLIAYGLVAWLAPGRVAGLPDEANWHGYVMFAIGATASAAALFHEYAARRAHAQQARRYELMAALYRRALDALDESQATTAWRDPDDGEPRSPLETARACLLELGHEALTENGDWLLMHRELPIELIAVH